VFDLETQEFFVSRDIIFHEDIFPYAMSSTSAPYSSTPNPPSLLTFDDTNLVPCRFSDQPLGLPPEDSPVPQPTVPPTSYNKGSFGPGNFRA